MKKTSFPSLEKVLIRLLSSIETGSEFTLRILSKQNLLVTMSSILISLLRINKVMSMPSLVYVEMPRHFIRKSKAKMRKE